MREWMINGVCQVCGNPTPIIGRCLSCGWESNLFKAECKIGKIVATAKSRMNKACDQIKAMRPTEFDWMTELERKKFHKLQLLVIHESMTQEEAKERCRRKRKVKNSTSNCN